MSGINIHANKNYDVTAVPNAFIDNYLKQSNPTFVIIYIYFYRHRFTNLGFTTGDVSEMLGILESDIVNGLKFWEKKGLIKLGCDEDYTIEFLDIPEKIERIERIEKIEKVEHPEAPKPVVIEPPKRKAASLEVRPSYSIEELEIYKNENNDIAELFSISEQALGKLLTYNDLNVLFGIYDWLRLPIDVIAILLTHCAENDHRNLNYIEKVAITWSENGINSIDMALDYIRTYTKDYREILKAFGQSSRTPTQSEINYMDKWLKQYQMPMELILEACDKTIMQTGKPGFKYADTILKLWLDEGVKTKEDVVLREESFHKSKEKASEATGESKVIQHKKNTQKPNRFVNFKQRDWDYDQILMLEREYLEESVNSPNAK